MAGFLGPEHQLAAVQKTIKQNDELIRLLTRQTELLDYIAQVLYRQEQRALGSYEDRRAP